MRDWQKHCRGGIMACKSKGGGGRKGGKRGGKGGKKR